MKKTVWVVGIALMVAGVAQAANNNWVGLGTNTEWSTSANWTGGVIPGTSTADQAIFSGGDVGTVNSAVTSPNAVKITVRNSSASTALTIKDDMDSISAIDIGATGNTSARDNKITQAAGTVDVSGTVTIGGNVDQTGTYKQTGGVLNAGAILVQTNGTYLSSGAANARSVTTASMTIDNGGEAKLGGKDLIVNATALNVGTTGAGTVSQTGAGSAVTTAGLNVGAGGIYTLTDGTLELTGGSALNGTMAINGGTLALDTVGNNDITVNGSGLLELTSGTWNDNATAGGDATIFNPNISISGGAVDLNGQNRFAGEFKVIGDAATINIARINDGKTADFVFEFDTDGVSTVISSDYVQLDGSTITADIGSYAGGTGDFVLFDVSANTNANAFVAYAALGDLDVSSWQTAFAGTYISQDVDDNNKVILHVIPEPATLGLVGLIGCGMIFIRRFKNV